MITPRGTVHLVRHAKAGDRSSWSGDDSQRPLTERGVAQSEMLAEALSGRLEAVEVDANATGDRRMLLSSPYVRCVQTLEPLARSLGAQIATVDWLAEGADARLAFDRLSSLPSGTVLCSHGDIIGEVLDMVLRRRIPVEPMPTGIKKCSVLEIDRTEVDGSGEIVAVRYLPPPAVG